MKKKGITIFVLIATTLFFSCVRNKDSNNKMDLKGMRNDTVRNASNEVEQVKTYFDDKLLKISFYTRNKLRKALKYIEVRDKIIPNELYIFNTNGDTLKNESLYHGIYCMNDTISSNEEYNFKIVLEGHVFNNAYLALADVNEDYPIKSDSSTVIEMTNFEGPALAIKGKRKGWNYIRGRIDNVKKLKQNDSVQWASVYFIDSFYVK